MVHFQTAHTLSKGACHCGAVSFSVTLPASSPALRCNCSLCAMRGAAMIGIKAQDLQILSGEDQLGCYRFHSHKAAHYFCKVCGIYTFHQRRTDPQVFAVNAACLTGVDVFTDYPATPVSDGRNHAEDNGGTFRVAGTLHYRPRSDG